MVSQSALWLTTLSPLLALAAADCDRAALKAAADSYLVSQTNGQLHASLAGSAITYKENNKIVDIKKGVLSRAFKIDHNKTTVDTKQCATYTEVISTDGPYVIGTQIHHNGNAAAAGSNGTAVLPSVVLIDSVVTTTGDWLFNASKSLELVLKEDWATIPADKQDQRETLQEAGDAYMDLWGHPTNRTVPWGFPCDRMEGSAYTGPGVANDTCAVGIPNGTWPLNTERRYVIDETVGSVSILCVFQTMRNGADSHEFRLNSGKLRYVHTMTVMRNLTSTVKRWRS